MKWFKMIVHGIVKHARNVKIGENGIAKDVINVHMEYHCPVNTVVKRDLIRICFKYAKRREIYASLFLMIASRHSNN